MFFLLPVTEVDAGAGWHRRCWHLCLPFQHHVPTPTTSEVQQQARRGGVPLLVAVFHPNVLRAQRAQPVVCTQEQDLLTDAQTVISCSIFLAHHPCLVCSSKHAPLHGAERKVTYHGLLLISPSLLCWNTISMCMKLGTIFSRENGEMMGFLTAQESALGVRHVREITPNAGLYPKDPRSSATYARNRKPRRR